MLDFICAVVLFCGRYLLLAVICWFTWVTSGRLLEIWWAWAFPRDTKKVVSSVPVELPWEHKKVDMK